MSLSVKGSITPLLLLLMSLFALFVSADVIATREARASEFIEIEAGGNGANNASVGYDSAKLALLPDESKTRSLIESRKKQSIRQAVTAVNGKALVFAENDQTKPGKFVRVRTSMPVFKAFDISADRKKLLYSPLKRGIPSGELYLEELSTHRRLKVTSRTILSAALSPANNNQIAYTFAGSNGFGLAIVDIESQTDNILVDSNVFSEIISWGDNGKGIFYFSTSQADRPMRLNSRNDPNKTFSNIDDWQHSDEPEPLLVTPAGTLDQLELSQHFIAPDGKALGSSSNPPTGFPRLNDKVNPPIDFLDFSGVNASTSKPSNSFRLQSPDGTLSVLGGDLLGTSKLVIKNEISGKELVVESAVISAVFDHGLIVKVFSGDRTITKHINWNGTANQLGSTVVDYRLPIANSTLIQGGSSYSSPGNCSLSAHFNTMSYAYDFQNFTVGAHALSVADGLVVYASGTMTCNQVQQSCPDYSPTGCPGFYLGNQVIIQHADGTYSALSHLEANSIQVEIGTIACQGLYVARQGHTGSTSGVFNNCGDHLHFQRQASPDAAGQSIPTTFSDVASHPLACGSPYSTSATEIVHSISTNSQNFPISGGNGSVAVTSNGCAWDAISNVGWIMITSPATNSGNGTVSYSVSDNSAGGSRTGTMVIGGHLFTVTQAGGGVTNTAPVVNAGLDQSVQIAQGATLSGTATDDGLPVPPGTLAVTWSKIIGPGSVSFVNANGLSTIANFSMAGIYVLRLTASDGSLTSTDEVKIVVNTTSGGGVMIGNQTTPPSNVDLTTEGTADWAHWGYTDASSFNRKSGALSQISNFTRIGSTGTFQSSSNGAPTVTFGWSDGTPVSGSVSTPTCIYTYGDNNGFEFTVPADNNQRTLKIYVDVWRVTGRLEAELSDGSASPFVDTSLSTIYPAGALTGVYTINYSAASAGQVLRVRWFIESSTYPVGNVALGAVTLSGGSQPANQAPVVGAGSDQALTLPSSASLSGTATDDGLPAPPSLTTTWSKVSGPGSVAFGNAGALSTTASFTSWGVYVLRLTASDGALSSSDDVTVVVNSSGGTGSLSVSNAVTPASVDLSAEGTADWAHWGLNSSTSFNHKHGTSPQVSNYSALGNGTIQQYTNNPSLYSWTGGTPTTSAANTATGLYVTGLGNGFEITAPADATTRTLRLYLGLWTAGGRLEASLSDGSAPIYVDTSLLNSTSTTNAVYTLDYQAASNGQTLTVKWTVNSVFNQASNVTLQAATLTGGVVPTPTPTPGNQPPVVNAGNGQTIVFPDAASLSGSVTDDGLPAPPSLTTTWSKLSGPGTVTFGNATALSTTANFSAPGIYVLRLTGSDGALSASDDFIITVNATGGTGLLSVNFAPTPGNTDLTTEGTSDWAHWGLDSSTSFNRKISALQQISNYAVLGSGTIQRYTNNPDTYTWSDGTPTAAATNTPTGVYVIGLNNGFEITAPAGTSTRRLKIYTGLWSAGGRFEAMLSDGSTAAFVDTSLVNSSGTSNRVYTLNYRAASDGQTLLVRWTVNTSFHQLGNVALQAATLAPAVVPRPPVFRVSARLNDDFPSIFLSPLPHILGRVPLTNEVRYPIHASSYKWAEHRSEIYLRFDSHPL